MSGKNEKKKKNSLETLAYDNKIIGSGYNSNEDDNVFEEKQQKKAYQVDFTVLSTTHLKSKQDKEVFQVSGILGNKNVVREKKKKEKK